MLQTSQFSHGVKLLHLLFTTVKPHWNVANVDKLAQKTVTMFDQSNAHMSKQAYMRNLLALEYNKPSLLDLHT